MSLPCCHYVVLYYWAPVLSSLQSLFYSTTFLFRDLSLFLSLCPWENFFIFYGNRLRSNARNLQLNKHSFPLYGSFNFIFSVADTIERIISFLIIFDTHFDDIPLKIKHISSFYIKIRRNYWLKIYNNVIPDNGHTIYFFCQLRPRPLKHCEGKNSNGGERRGYFILQKALSKVEEK